MRQGLLLRRGILSASERPDIPKHNMAWRQYGSPSVRTHRDFKPKQRRVIIEFCQLPGFSKTKEPSKSLRKSVS